MTRIATLGVWVAVAAAAVFWGMKLFVRTAPVPAQATTVSGSQALRGDLTRLLGAAAEPEDTEEPVVAAASRFRLIGVVAPRSPKAAGEGLALIGPCAVEIARAEGLEAHAQSVLRRLEPTP